MADQKISALTAATTPLAGTEVLPIVQSASTVKVAVNNLCAGPINVGGSWTATSAWTIPAVTLGGTVSGGGNQINNVVIGAVTPLAGSFTTLNASGDITGSASSLLIQGGGIGWPSYVGQSAGRTTFAAASGNALLCLHDDTAVAADIGPAGIYFGSRITDAPTYYPYGVITAKKGNATPGNADGYLSFLVGVNGVGVPERMRLSSTGLSVTGTTSTTTGMAVGGATAGAGGIAFPATAVAVADVNTLDDYEEGTWTPTITAGTGTFTAVSATGKYTKIGNLVSCTLSILITTNGTAATNIQWTPPFTSAGISAGCGREMLATGKTVVTTLDNAAASGNCQNYDNTYPGGDGYNIYISHTYFV